MALSPCKNVETLFKINFELIMWVFGIHFNELILDISPIQLNRPACLANLRIWLIYYLCDHKLLVNHVLSARFSTYFPYLSNGYTGSFHISVFVPFYVPYLSL